MSKREECLEQTVQSLEESAAQGDIDAKRELARRLMEGEGATQNHSKAVALLEDCVNLGDSQAMVMLAECYTFGRGIKQDVERANSLIFQAAEKGNKEALSLIGLINDCKGQKRICIGRLMVS